MKISVFGLGYVGAVSAACFAKEGHSIVGVDAQQEKVNILNEGRSPIIEKDLDVLIKDAVDNQRLVAVTDGQQAIADTELSFICVGTPSQLNGSLDLTYVRRVCEQIGEAIAKKSDFHTVVIRSTMLPGTMNDLVIPTLEEYSGKQSGKDFGVCINPEFLRESTAVFDFYNPPKTVIGETDEKSGALLASLYDNLDAPLVRTTVDTAEMVKYTDNAWHALKVGFANEIGTICKNLELDSHKVMDIFCKDEKLNLSSYYMKPGFAFGGSCLPKDLRALNYKAKTMDLDLPILKSVLPANEVQIKRGLDLITAHPTKKVGILGFSFKAGTDDLRESPLVEIIERLIGKGYDLKLYDRNVSLASLTGANKNYILNHIPHISKLMVDSIENVMEHADLIVIGNNDPQFVQAVEQRKSDQVIIDYVRVAKDLTTGDGYEGICW